MKMNFTSPVWLQSASNVGGGKEYISFVDAMGNPQIKLSCDGDLQIVSTYNGDEMIQTLSNISQQAVSIQSDPNTEIFIYGKVTSFDTTVSYPGGTTEISELNTLHAKSLTYLYCPNNPLTSLDVRANTALTELDCGSNQLTSLDVSANTALTYLFCNNNQLTSLNVGANTALTELYCNNNQLTSLNVGANTALTELDCNNNQNITDIQLVAVNSSVASSIADAIAAATSVDGTVTLRQGDEYNQTIIDAAMEKGWDVQYAE